VIRRRLNDVAALRLDRDHVAREPVLEDVLNVGRGHLRVSREARLRLQHRQAEALTP